MIDRKEVEKVIKSKQDIIEIIEKFAGRTACERLYAINIVFSLAEKYLSDELIEVEYLER